MDATEVQYRVMLVSTEQDNAATADWLEKDLWRDVLLAIAEGRADDPAAVATEALKTEGIEFTRGTVQGATD